MNCSSADLGGSDNQSAQVAVSVTREASVAFAALSSLLTLNPRNTCGYSTRSRRDARIYIRIFLLN